MVAQGRIPNELEVRNDRSHCSDDIPPVSNEVCFLSGRSGPKCPITVKLPPQADDGVISVPTGGGKVSGERGVITCVRPFCPICQGRGRITTSWIRKHGHGPHHCVGIRRGPQLSQRRSPH